MRNSAKLGLTALIAALLLASALSTASARNLSTDNQNIRSTWRSLEFVSALVTIRCPVTLEGAFHSRTIPKVARLLIGSVTRVDIKNEVCTNGRASVEGFPWHITYESFTGTLPNISSVRVLLQRFLFNLITLGLTCKYGRSSDNITGAANLNSERLVTTLVPVAGSNTANLKEGRTSFPECPPSGNMVGAATDGITRVLNTGAQIKITLI